MTELPVATGSDCWNRIGVHGDRSCPELDRVVHCHNCPVFGGAGRQFLDAPPPQGYLDEWTRRLAAPIEAPTTDLLGVLIFRLGEEWLALPVALLVTLACLYNLAAIADSSTHSTVLAESVPPHYLGVAYAVRSVVGFGAGVVSPFVFGWALDLAGGAKTSADAFAWGIAWSTLALGALLGPLATWKLYRMR